MGQEFRDQGRRLVFTNGCFDLLHAGHVRYLAQAGDSGDGLMIGLNSDDSVRRIKGPRRPLMPQDERAEVLGALAVVDFVVIFEEDTPFELISAVGPMVLCKGGDWAAGDIVGADVVLSLGGEVKSLPFVNGASTTSIIDRIVERYASGEKK